MCLLSFAGFCWRHVDDATCCKFVLAQRGWYNTYPASVPRLAGLLVSRLYRVQTPTLTFTPSAPHAAMTCLDN